MLQMKKGLRTILKPIITDSVLSDVSEIVGSGLYLIILETFASITAFHWAALRSAALLFEFPDLLKNDNPEKK